MLIIPEEVRREAADIYYNQAGVEDGIMTYKQADFPKGVGVYDVECGRFADKQPYTWQTDDRLEDNITWCIVQDPKYKSAYRILQQLCDVVSKNGNLLLNVGPNADGSFPEEAKRELYKVGDWLRKYGEAIYGAEPFDVAHEGVTKATDEDYNVERVKQQMKDGIAMEAGQYRLTGRDFRFTQKGKNVYVLCMGKAKTASTRSGPWARTPALRTSPKSKCWARGRRSMCTPPAP
jgi:alpha-L-fucosidase